MGQISGQKLPKALPPPAGGVNVNFCTNPDCANFRIPIEKHNRDSNYSFSGTGKTRSIKCKKCGQFTIVKSNKAICEEILRLQYPSERATVYRQDGTACHNAECENFGQPHSKNPSMYRKIGRTDKGNQRYQCKRCLTRFTFGSEKRTAQPEGKRYLNDVLFRMLVNKVPIARIPEITDLAPATIYRKIDMFYERCVEFMHDRESRLRNRDLGRLYLSTDRQEYHANWTDEIDKRHIVVTAIGTADRNTRYIFGMETNFDSSIDLTELTLRATIEEDKGLEPPNRVTARLWTEADYKAAVRENKRYKASIGAELANAGIQTEAAANVLVSGINEQWELENGAPPEAFSAESYLPQNGCLVHLEYTMFAHFENLKKLVGHAGYLNFFVDREAGINRALALSFGDRFSDREISALYVAASKNLTVDERQALVRITKTEVDELIKSGIAESENEAELMIAQQGLAVPSLVQHGREYFSIPVHRINEAQKMVSFITSTNGYTLRNKAFLAKIASLSPIDSFFNQVRRRIQALERPIHSQSNQNRVWRGYSPYSPEQIAKMLQIFRCYRNFVLVGEDGKTPAEKIGLAKGPVEIRRILYPRA